MERFAEKIVQKCIHAYISWIWDYATHASISANRKKAI